MNKKTKIIITVTASVILLTGVGYAAYEYIPSVHNLGQNKQENTSETETGIESNAYISKIESEKVVDESNNYTILFLSNKNKTELNLELEGFKNDGVQLENGLNKLTSLNEQDSMNYILFIGDQAQINDLIFNLKEGKIVYKDDKFVAQSTLDAQDERLNEESADKKNNTTVKVENVYIEGSGNGSNSGNSGSSGSGAGYGIDLNRYNGLNCGLGAQLFLKDNGHNGQRHDVTGSELQPYDLLYYNNGSYDHNSVYIGDGMMFECGIQPDSHCAISPLRTDYESVWRE